MTGGAWSLDPKLFASTFALIFVAEIPDKTALATLSLATGHRPVAVFYGVAAAFVIQSAVAVGCGSAISLFPKEGIRIVAGLLFLAFAVAMWTSDRRAAGEAAPDSPRQGFFRTVGHAFLVIFIAEWGDLTQLATAALAAKCPEPWTIFLAATLALWSVTVVAIVIGHHLKRHISPRILRTVAAIAFAVIGVVILAKISLTRQLG